MPPKILFFAGSARRESLNKKLAKSACELASKSGATATFIDLADYPMPIYDGDLESEHGIPETAVALKKLFAEHDGFFIASPEYNSSFSSLLKNTLDWLSRPGSENEPPMIAFKGKTAAIASTSPGGLGGMRGLVPLRMMLGNISVHVIPNQIAVSNAFEAFDENGTLVNENQLSSLAAVVDQLVDVTTKLS